MNEKVSYIKKLVLLTFAVITAVLIIAIAISHVAEEAGRQVARLEMEQQAEIVSLDIERKPGYNSVEINFRDMGYIKESTSEEAGASDVEETEGISDGSTSESGASINLDNFTGVVNCGIDLYCVYNNETAYYTLEEAQAAGAIEQYKASPNRIKMLIKTGYKFNGVINPLDVENVVNWSDSMANLPLEIEATNNGDGKLTRFTIYMDYSSNTVKAQSKTEIFD